MNWETEDYSRFDIDSRANNNNDDIARALYHAINLPVGMWSDSQIERMKETGYYPVHAITTVSTGKTEIWVDPHDGRAWIVNDGMLGRDS